MKKKVIFLSLMALTSFCFIETQAQGTLIDSIDVSLEQQESQINDKIRYVSTMVLNSSTTLEDISNINLEISISKTGQETKSTSVALQNVYSSIAGTNGKAEIDNTYYAIYTITDLSKYYPGWTLNADFKYDYKDGTYETTNAINYIIPGSHSLKSGSGSFEETHPLFADNVQDGQILQCFCWSYNEIMNYLPKIASQGFTAIQTSPVQVCKEATAGKNAKGSWWAYYQPAAFTIDDTGDNALGTPEEFEEMVELAHSLGVKVLVDVVANHLGNQWVADSLCERAYYYEWEIAGMAGPANPDAKEGEVGYIPYTGEYWRYQNGSLSTTKVIDTYYYKDTLKFHPYSVQDNDEPGNVTQGNIGMMDLDTNDPVVQNAVADYLEELIAYGVDGFRFDAAKHIETPNDDISSNFWPYVMERARAAASAQGRDVYAYGEILNRPGTGRSLSWYTDLGIAITDSGLGHGIVENGGTGFGSFNGADGNDYIDYKEDMVVWAESHDNYMGTGDTHNKSEEIINKSYAILSARKDFSTLYCARFEDYEKSTLGSVACLNGWSYDCVGAVNKFHNFYSKLDADESCSESGGYNCIERFINSNSNQNGVVIVGNAGQASVSVSHLANGTYTDAVTGNTFTVSNGTLSGTVGDSGVAVIFNNTSNTIGNVSISSNNLKTFYTASASASYYINNAKSATLTIDGDTYDITSGAEITFGYDMEVGDIKTIRITAIGLNNTEIYKEYTYKKVEAPRKLKVYFEKPSEWESVSAILYKDGVETPTTVTKDSSGKYCSTYLEGFYTHISFTNGTEFTESIKLEENQTYRLAEKSNGNYFANDNGWENINLYMWNDTTGKKNAEWPGVALTETDEETGYYIFDTTGYEKVIFNSGGIQTVNILAVESDYPIVYHLSGMADGKYAVTTGYLLQAGTPCDHTYGEPSFDWKDYTSAAATFTCSSCDKTKTIDATITNEITKEPTETETGIRTYTATVDFDNHIYTATKTEVIPSLNTVTVVDRVEATCTTDGNILYYIKNNKYYSDANCENEIALEDTIIPAVGHHQIEAGLYLKDQLTCSVCHENVTIDNNVIYYINVNDWTTVYAYAWKNAGGAGNQNSAWPGVLMTDTGLTYNGHKVYSYTNDNNYTSIIFTNGNGTQTGDLTIPGDANCYNDGSFNYIYVVAE